MKTALDHYYDICPLPKGTPRKLLKARLKRAEKKVADACRRMCVERDGHCRICFIDAFEHGIQDVITDAPIFLPSNMGESQWSHLPERRRSKTMRMDPTYRHDPRFTLQLCQRHHDMLDGRAFPKLIITALTRKGCDGPLKFRLAKTTGSPPSGKRTGSAARILSQKAQR